MSILINKDTKVITQGITGKTGQFTRMSLKLKPLLVQQFLLSTFHQQVQRLRSGKRLKRTSIWQSASQKVFLFVT
jgi:succinyl-CoA synthetase alpha subunit